MTTLHLIILAVIQGLTEFLPVSSSGHLVLLPHILKWQDQGFIVDVALHVGTLMAVILYFKYEIRLMIRDCFSYVLGGFKKGEMTPFVWLSFCLIIATLPAVGVGFFIKKSMPEWFRNPLTIAATSAIFGVVLYAVDRGSKTLKSMETMTLKEALIIGFIQCLALVPGTSRSGSCMWAARLLNFDRQSAARFSFLLSLPAIIAAATLTFVDVLKSGQTLPWQELGL
ncbi:MAG TPA: undecaprenyl-diphosphate phosphatase, partial [Alphaproteobacteria bacterium]|nr:undecaprenyl-diphosphate phosphatase [Alphaproteobacteria bacterium]